MRSRVLRGWTAEELQHERAIQEDEEEWTAAAAAAAAALGAIASKPG